MRVKRLLSALFLLWISHAVQAAGIFIEGGLHVGGDTLVTVLFIDGSTQSIKGGEILSASIGMTDDISDVMRYRASIGIKLDGILAENGDVTFSRFPLEFMLFTKGESVSFGMGLSYHLDPEVSASGSFVVGGNFNQRYDDALGVVAEIDLNLSTGAYLGIKATFIDYRETDIGFGAAEFSGNSIGAVIGVYF